MLINDASFWMGLFAGVLLTAACFYTLTSPRSNSQGFYGSTRSWLNLRVSVTSGWFNFGYWKNGPQRFCDAARNLAVQLGKAASLTAVDRVLDVGCGAGDQLQVWSQEFQVECTLGVTPEVVPMTHASKAVRVLRAKDDCVEVWQSARALGINKILSLDSAYHFQSRKAFCERCLGILPSGGVVALVDIVYQGGPKLKQWVHRLFFRFAGIPAQNLWTRENYEASLARLGFTDIDIQDIHSDVMPGFAQWLDTHLVQLQQAQVLSPLVRLKLWGIRWMARKLSSGDSIRYAIVTARKP